MRNAFIAVVLCLLFGNFSQLQAQPGKESNPYILFTGLVLTSDSLQAIPYVTIKTRKRGMIGYTDVYGHFEVVVKKGDTIFFNQVEQLPSFSIVPDTLTASKYSVVKLMVQDTITMDAIFIHAMPLKTLFNNEFVHSDIPDDAYERARKNLENEALKDEYRLRPADANASQMYLAQSRVNRMYYYGQTPPQNYLSPSAWLQFFDAWKRGDYKKKTARKSLYITPY
ncbi:MAG: carboxypeptidase-like regulatory domain-containing protein [Bacteroidetes bacterium]|jgi:hypothetical protein|nr:carboxypeptidase-like regulatory domain-containing protein [Bacteroidota bacterium]